MKSSELINIGSKLLREKNINSHKLDTEINRVNCNNQAIDKNINNIRKKPFNSSLKI